MNNKIEIIFDQEDFDLFREWLHLNMDALTWQGRFENEFEEFWQVFFVSGVSLKQLQERFSYASVNSKIGPLSSWFFWLRDKFLIYTFIFKRISLYDLANEFDVHVSELASILHGFFLERLPYLDDYFNSVLLVGNVTSDNLFLTYEKIANDAQFVLDFNGSSDNEVMASMEVTLYDEWFDFVKKIQREFLDSNSEIKEKKSSDVFKKYSKFLKDTFLLTFVGAVFIYGIYEGNRWYETYLADKIRVYEPQFLWASKSLKFKEDSNNIAGGKVPKIKKLDLDEVVREVAAVTKEGSRSFEGAGTFGTETEVVLTSWDSMPKDFDTAGLEQSDYEELRKGGYRDTRFGNKKVYRLMMNSVDALKTRDELNQILDKYNIVQVDNVAPGTEVPGGVYYNLFVPRDALKEFISQVMDVEEAILYESLTRGKNLPGMNKVFIWIKTL